MEFREVELTTWFQKENDRCSGVCPILVSIYEVFPAEFEEKRGVEFGSFGDL